MTVDEIEAIYGRPREAVFLVEYTPAEFTSLGSSMRDGRNQDVTLLIRRAGPVAMIRKPIYPPDCFRAPGGGPRRGEDLAAAGLRETREETGLQARLQAHPLRAHATFRCGNARIQWVTHVFTAAAGSEILEPRDRGEMAEARWFAPAECCRINATLARGTLSGLRYRAALQAAACAAMCSSP